jgi:hypothetical protein
MQIEFGVHPNIAEVAVETRRGVSEFGQAERKPGGRGHLMPTAGGGLSE